MSDRARSSVRTEPRAGAGAPDEVPSGAVPAAGAQPATDGERKGSTAVGAGGGTLSARTPVAQPPSGQVPVTSTPAEKSPAAQAPEPAPEVKPTEGPADKAGQAPAEATQAPAGTSQTPAKATPAGKAAQTSAGKASKAPAGGGVGTARGGVPAAGSVPVEATQAVTLPPAAAPPATGQSRAVESPASRPAGAAESPASRPAGAAESPASRPAGAAAAGGKPKGAARGPRRARLQLRHIDTWSALKISLVLSIALFFVWMVAVGILYGVLNGLGVFDSINDLFGQLRSASGEEGPSGELVSAGTVFGGAAVIGAVNIVLLTALCTVTAFVYNLCSDLVGGLEVTLAERD
ncbi:DUF3566 domain-containing protein [Modestobacter sp. I12A-02662]|uniref:DUF3566 domain-containing protein n=1 Tax=Modestobacter sp. I12A-02662 TaxID=1730496 RepID=UPI0034DEBBA3